MRFVWEKGNRILFWLAVILITVGYIIMSTGDKTLSPIILIISYLVLVPLALVFPFKKKEPRD
jgi:hypothetical protein